MIFISSANFLPQSFWFWRFIWKAAAFRGPSLPGRKPKPFPHCVPVTLPHGEKLIRHNLRLVAHIVKKYYALPGDQDDLISIGTIGLMKAVDTFDSDRRARFSTYASRCIENAILSPAHFQMEKRIHSFCKAA